MSNWVQALCHPRHHLKSKWVRAFGDYESKIKLGLLARSNYGYCLYNAAALAQKLGYPRISAIEFGVAGGNGLVALEAHAALIEQILPIKIELYGFDTGEGLPRPIDYRDLPYQWREGFYRMDVPALKSRLKSAKLILGNVSDTLGGFFAANNPAPIGAISFDLDFYSSTKTALEIFKGGAQFLMPRIFCYFDDTIGRDIELYNDFTGQRLAINEFNRENEFIKLGHPYYLHHSDYTGGWREQVWIAHLFKHPDYDRFVSEPAQRLPLR